MDRFVVMGVSGCGKSSIAARFAAQIGARFTDGDDLHPKENVAKMAVGTPLTDEDRAPWLAAVGKKLTRNLPHVIACSALKRAYRDNIRSHACADVMFIHLDGTKALIAARMDAREGHFMPTTLLDSQFADLEPPQADELSLRIDIDQTPDAIVSELITQFGKDML